MMERSSVLLDGLLEHRLKKRFETGWAISGEPGIKTVDKDIELQ